MRSDDLRLLCQTATPVGDSCHFHLRHFEMDLLSHLCLFLVTCEQDRRLRFGCGSMGVEHGHPLVLLWFRWRNFLATEELGGSPLRAEGMRSLFLDFFKHLSPWNNWNICVERWTRRQWFKVRTSVAEKNRYQRLVIQRLCKLWDGPVLFFSCQQSISQPVCSHQPSNILLFSFL